MEFMDTVLKRQSCRSFTEKQISEKDLETILKAANASPVSMGLYENIHLSVVQNPAVIASLEDFTFRTFPDEGDHAAYQAPTVISINCRKKEKESGAWADASAIAENMLLTAADLGLGSIYLMGIPLAVRTDRALCQKLQVPDGFLPYVMVGIGYAAKEWEKRSFTTERISVSYIR